MKYIIFIIFFISANVAADDVFSFDCKFHDKVFGINEINIIYDSNLITAAIDNTAAANTKLTPSFLLVGSLLRLKSTTTYSNSPLNILIEISRFDLSAKLRVNDRPVSNGMCTQKKLDLKF